MSKKRRHRGRPVGNYPSKQFDPRYHARDIRRSVLDGMDARAKEFLDNWYKRRRGNSPLDEGK